MVNPNKHEKNLNNDDLENIYNRLNQQYERARDYNSKKDINQQILILILLCRRFPILDLIKIDYGFFDSEPSNSILHKHINEQIKNNFCEIDGLLLTNRQNKPLNIEDINKLLSNIDANSKELSVETLSITNSFINDFGKINFNKKIIKRHIELNDKIKILKESLHNHEKNEIETQVTLEELTDKIDKISSELNSNNKLHFINTNEEILKELKQIKEKEKIMEDKIGHDYAQMNELIQKIHENINSTKIKYETLNENIETINKSMNQIEFVKNEQPNENSKYDELKLKLDEILNALYEKKSTQNNLYDNININKSQNGRAEIKKDTSQSKINTPTNKSNKETIIKLEEYEDFVNNWFDKHLLVTEKIKDSVSDSEIKEKLKKYLSKRNIVMNTKLLDEIEDYLKKWFNNQSNSGFSTIKKITNEEKTIYTNIKFIDIKQDHENRIKNTVINWIKSNTKEENDARTYTQDIFDKLKPIFEENGWIIVDKKGWTELQNTGITKICESRTFSQIIGKSIKEVYSSINSDTIQRDLPNESKKVTWYPNIKLLNKEMSSELKTKIKNELSDDIFDSDNMIYTWLSNNLEYTGNYDDKVYQSTLLEKLEEYLLKLNITISSKTLEDIFVNGLKQYLRENNIEYDTKNEIRKLKLVLENHEKIEKLANIWIKDHVIKTNNPHDITYHSEIKEKILSMMINKKITLVSEEIYNQLPSNLQHECFKQQKYDRIIDNTLKKLLEDFEKIDNSNDDIYYKSMKIMRYKSLNSKIIKKWIDENIEILLEPTLVLKEDIMIKFKEYMEKEHIKSVDSLTLMQMLNSNIHSYYDNKKNLELKDLNDGNEEYYGIMKY